MILVIKNLESRHHVFVVRGRNKNGSIDGKMNNEKESNDWEISSISKHPDFTSLKLRQLFHGGNRVSTIKLKVR